MKTNFIQEMGFEKVDLRKNLKCSDCGISLTGKNWGNSKQEYGKPKQDFCENCYLKPINLWPLNTYYRVGELNDG